MGVAEVGGTSKVTTAEGQTFEATDVRVGNPHAVVTVTSLDDAGALTKQPDFDASVYPDGVNIEFVQVLAPDHISIRIHERGSGETRSCGTGAVAAAVATAREQTRVDVPGGTLTVSRRPDGTTVLTGPAEIVAQGEIEWLTYRQYQDEQSSSRSTNGQRCDASRACRPNSRTSARSSTASSGLSGSSWSASGPPGPPRMPRTH